MLNVFSVKSHLGFGEVPLLAWQACKCYNSLCITKGVSGSEDVYYYASVLFEKAAAG